jgi:beta-lactamase superfamily II metal-dependent hydrolase
MERTLTQRTKMRSKIQQQRVSRKWSLLVNQIIRDLQHRVPAMIANCQVPYRTIVLYCLWTSTVVLASLTHSVAFGEEPISVRAISWNLESGDSDADFLANQCLQKGRVDIWGFCEVESRDFAETIEERIESQAGTDYELFVSDDQHQDKLAILFDKDRFEEVDRLTLESVRLNSSGLRPMILVRLRGRQSGREFFFGVNHLKASGGAANVQKRIQQSKIINDWAETQVLPIVICGDFNYPYPVAAGAQPPIDFQEIIADGVYQWIKPDHLIKTQQNPSFNSILDFYFVAHALPGWEGKSRILDREGNQEATSAQFGDDGEQTDHRPVEAVFTFDGAADEEASDELRNELAILNAQREQLENQLQAVEHANTGEREIEQPEVEAFVGAAPEPEPTMTGATTTEAADNPTEAPEDLPSGHLKIIHIRVGQGDSTLVVGPEQNGKSTKVLIDAGNLPKSGFDGGKIVGAVLAKLGITELDYVIATHYDADHIGGMIAGQEHLHGKSFILGRNGAPGEAGDDDNDGREDWLDSPLTMMHPDPEELGQDDDIQIKFFVDRGDDGAPTTQTFKKYQAMAQAMGVRESLEDQADVDGYEIDLGGGAVMTCLAANGFVRDRDQPIANVNTENEQSLCFLLKYKGFHYLTGGDTIGRQFGQENAAVEAAIGEYLDEHDIEVDILHVNHHGANNASADEFLTSVMPEIAIISLGNDNDHHHPNKDTLRRLAAAGIYRIYQTAWGTTEELIPAEVRRHQAIMQDDIVVTTDGVRYEISTSRSFPVDD